MKSEILPAWGSLIPEIVVAVSIVAVILIALVRSPRLKSASTAVVFYTTLIITAYFVSIRPLTETNLLQFDELSRIFQYLTLFSFGLLYFFIFRHHFTGKFSSSIAEASMLLLISLLAGMVMVSTHHFMMVIFAAEVISLSSYLLIGMGGKSFHAEASLKYFLFGAVISAFMIFGTSLLYGYTLSLDFTNYNSIRGMLVTANEAPLSVLIASFFFLMGLFIKVSFVPFHFWVPDVYQGASTPVTAYLSTIPKLFGFAVLIRFLSALDNISLIFVEVDFDYRDLVSLMAILTLVVSNTLAVLQRDIKRMLAYSSVSHSAFMVMAILSFSSKGVEAFWYYYTVYLVMNLVSFYLAWVYKRHSGSYLIADMKNSGMPVFLGVVWVIAIAALVGLPPTSGFTAKLVVFTELWEAFSYSGNQNLVWLLIAGLIATVISLFYYLKIPIALFFNNQPVKKQEKINVATDIGFVAFLSALLILLFIRPDILIRLFSGVNFVF